MDDSQKLKQAYHLIKAGQHNEARQVLKATKGEKAAAMLAKLDARYPAQQRRRVRPWVAAAVVILIMLSLGIGYVLSLNSAAYAEGRLQGKLTVYCIQLSNRMKVDQPGCGEWGETTLIAQRAAVMECDQLAADDTSLFQTCLTTKKIFPPGVRLP